MSDPISSLQAGEIIDCEVIDPQSLIREALEAAHYAGWYRETWEGSVEASDRIVKALGLDDDIPRCPTPTACALKAAKHGGVSV